MAQGVFQNRNGFRHLGRPRFLPGLAFHLVLPIFSSRSSALIDLLIFGPKRCDRLKGKPTVYADIHKRCEPSCQRPP